MFKIAQVVRKIDLESKGIIFASESQAIEDDRKILSEQLHELYMSDFRFHGI